MLIAVTRAISTTFADCELTHIAREPIDVARATVEHAAYEDALRALGAMIVRAQPLPDHPDAVFVEDTAIVLDEIAVLTRPGAPTRRNETASVAEVLGRYRALTSIAAPGTLDGGDVLLVGRSVFIGRSSRTDAAAIAQLGRLLRPFGYRVIAVDVTGCLHLKSAVTVVGDGMVLANPGWVSTGVFAPHEVLPVDDAEPGAANALRIGDAVVFADHYPRTARRLEQSGIRVVPVPCAEVAKAEGGVTCCSLIFESDRPAA